MTSEIRQAIEKAAEEAGRCYMMMTQMELQGLVDYDLWFVKPQILKLLKMAESGSGILSHESVVKALKHILTLLPRGE